MSALFLRPMRLLRPGKGVEISLSRSAVSFCDITSSQKDTTASHDSALPTILRTTAGSDRSPPTSFVRIRRCSSHATYSASVCSAVSSPQWTQWWHRASGSLPMRHRYLPKQPCPDSPKRQGAVPSPEPIVEYWPDRLDGSEAGGRAQKPLPPFRHQDLTELLSAQRDMPLHRRRAPCPLFLAPSI